MIYHHSTIKVESLENNVLYFSSIQYSIAHSLHSKTLHAKYLLKASRNLSLFPRILLKLEIRQGYQSL